MGGPAQGAFLGANCHVESRYEASKLGLDPTAEIQVDLGLSVRSLKSDGLGKEGSSFIAAKTEEGVPDDPLFFLPFFLFSSFSICSSMMTKK